MVRRPISRFPPPETADQTGLVAVSDRLDVDLLLDAYAHGIFPWSEDPVCWYSPDPRAIFVRDRIRLPRRLGKIMRRQGFRVTFDRAFEQVMRACATTHRDGGTWITSGFLRAYGELHRLGHAHSVEVWREERLVGGLYGVQLAGLFAGESMFYIVSNASKVAFAYLVQQLDRVGTVLFDAQVLHAFTLQLGAVMVRRHDYLTLLRRALTTKTQFGGQRWPTEPPGGGLPLPPG